MPTTYANSINSNPIFADRADKDASGNVITTTYATKADGLPAKSASDAGKVLTVNSAGSASWEASKTLTAGSGISITEGSDVVTIAANVLPSYNASDSAKVLSVNSAGTGVEWAAASGGSSDILILDYTNDISVHLQDSWDSYWAAIDAGKMCYMNVYGRVLPLVYTYKRASTSQASILTFVEYGADSAINSYRVDLTMAAYSNTVTVTGPTSTNLDVVPSYSSTDSGKVLTVAPRSGFGGYSPQWKDPVTELPSKDASDAGKALVVNSAGTGVEWASVGGSSSTVATSGCIAGDGSSNNKINLLYDGSLDLTSPEYTLTINSSGTYGTCGTLTAYSSEVLAVLPAPCSFYFQGFQWPGMSQTCTASCYLYCPSTQALIRSESTTIYASGNPRRANITLDVNNPAEGSIGVFDGSSYEYDWEVYLVINGSETSFTDADLISHAKLSVKNASLLSNSAGIKNIISTAALPASPASDVLYLIPEA